MEKRTDLKNKINSAALCGTPFLFALNYELTDGFVIENPLDQTDILWRVGNHSNFTPQKITSQSTQIDADAMPIEKYAEKFNYVKNQLLAGNSFLANLTVKTPINTDFSLKEILYHSNSPYALLIPDKLVCFSPEIFVKIRNNKISSNPMKGTISANENNAENTILSDYKESAEHFTIVDLIRSDLSRVATNITVNRLRYIDRLKTSKGDILQVSSEISGEVLDGYKGRLGDMIFELLPAGSISGAPKQPTVNVIQQAESEPRGFYTGVFGYFDGSELDSAVMIRYIEREEGQMFFRSGGGITINSVCEDEYNEVLAKIYLPF